MADYFSAKTNNFLESQLVARRTVSPFSSLYAKIISCWPHTELKVVPILEKISMFPHNLELLLLLYPKTGMSPLCHAAALRQAAAGDGFNISKHFITLLTKHNNGKRTKTARISKIKNSNVKQNPAWHRCIMQELSEAQCFLLVSVSFLSRGYIYCLFQAHSAHFDETVLATMTTRHTHTKKKKPSATPWEAPRFSRETTQKSYS